jgi:hypothetical protein
LYATVDADAVAFTFNTPVVGAGTSRAASICMND